MESEVLLGANSAYRHIPSDRFHAVLSIFFILGIGSLLPWNFFINAKQYFMYKLRNVNMTDDSSSWTNSSAFNENQKLYESYVEVSAMLPAILFMLFNVVVSKLIMVEKRVIVALCVMVAMFVVTVTFARVNTDTWQETFFILSLLSVAVMNAASAVLQGGSCGLASFFPKKYIQTLMAGQGLGGLLASVANIVTIMLASSPIDSGFSYFLIALFVIVLSLGSFLVLMRCDFYHFNVTGSIQCSSLVVNVTSSSDDYSVEFEGSDTQRLTQQLNTEHQSQNCCHNMATIFKQICVEGFVAFFVFLVTLCCFPALTSAIESVSKQHSQWTDVYFVPVCCFLLFNLCDFIGRSVSGLFQWPSESSRILLVVLSVFRVGFIPIFLLSNIDLPNRRINCYIHNDFVPVIMQCLLGFSNGYLSTLAMMYAPRRVLTQHVETVGAMMSFFLSFGLGCGALLSVFVVQFIA